MPKIQFKDKLPSSKAIIILSVGLILAVISYVYPALIVKMLNYKDLGGSLLFRSGLDGDTSYYNNIWQAVTSPYAKSLIRPWSSLISIIIFCVIAFILGGTRKNNRGSEDLMNSIFLFSPWYSWAFFGYVHRNSKRRSKAPGSICFSY